MNLNAGLLEYKRNSIVGKVIGLGESSGITTVDLVWFLDKDLKEFKYTACKANLIVCELSDCDWTLGTRCQNYGKHTTGHCPNTHDVVN